MLDKLKQQKQKLLDPEVSREPSFKDEVNSICPSLSYQERVIGFLTCFLLGFLLSFGSTFRLAKLVHGNPGPFAIAYTIGNLLSLGSSMFFVGPCKQVETMFRKKRRGSAIIYLSFIVVTLVLCFARDIPHRFGLVMISVICQFAALVWYTLSYIPYGRQMVTSCFKRVVGMANEDDM
ncbi:hypothetical protein P43SY_002021 [Pythium insidiosum]|uniref:Vesicle transport protein n=1 Tax=Pythium insidiosum TaxID=114742 RepID=A0AAD5LXP9_PYTIN|nr:hypothetical protein ATCC90586_005114 [Pythium insidiosum]KAJ0395890.1 hypothetical protein P43SY_002021 [Pythium insidiosum]